MTAAGVVRGVVFFAVLIGAPMVGLQHWVLNMLVFTLMFAVMASGWNLVGGFAGYPSLGHAAFFGIGAYGVGLHFHGQHLSTGYEPFLWLPVIGAIGALIGAPIAAISMRTRADVFAIVTITLLFVVQTLASNLRGLTGGSQGLAVPLPPFPAATFEQPYYYVLVAMYLAYKLGGSQFYLIAYALVFLLIMLALPRGIVPTVVDALRRQRLRMRAAATGVPSDERPESIGEVALPGRQGR
jgi:branched-chain amino acid transport system permease protein